MAPPENPAIPKGSTVLITGVSGLLGSNIADQFLHYGYKVRGTVRDLERSSWLTELFEKKYGKGSFELIPITEMAVEGTFDEAVRGASAVVHTASVMVFDSNPHNVIPTAIAGAVNALKSAYAEPSVKRFVLTSSSSAAVLSSPGTPGILVTKDTWNEDAIKEAWAEPPYGLERSFAVYAASKSQAEKEVWKFHKENQYKRPELAVNTVLPNVNFGKSLDIVNQGHASSSSLPASLWKGEVTPQHHFVVPQYFIDVRDSGRLHVAGAILPDVKDERIFAFAARFNWDAVLDVFRKHEPEKKFPENFSSGDDPNEIEARGRAEQMLRDLGQPGWTSLEDSLLMNIEDLRTAA